MTEYFTIFNANINYYYSPALQNVRDAVLVVVDRDRGPICSALAYKDIPDDAI